MSVHVMARVFNASRTRSPIQQLILLAIANHCGEDDGSGAWPSLATIARETKLTPRSVRRGIRALESCGDLEVVRGGGRDTSSYRVLVSDEEGAQETPRTECPPVTGSRERGHSVRAPETARPVAPDTVSADPYKNRPKKRQRTVIDITEGRKAAPSTATSSVVSGFDAFWKIYPRRVAKQAAEREWTRLSPDAELQQTILKAVEQQRTCPQWVKEGGQFIPHARTWLSQKRWEDEPEPTGARISEGGRSVPDADETAKYLAQFRGAH